MTVKVVVVIRFGGVVVNLLKFTRPDQALLLKTTLQEKKEVQISTGRRLPEQIWQLINCGH